MNTHDDVAQKIIAVQKISEIARAYHDARIFDGVVAVSSLDKTIYEGAYGQASREFGVPYTTNTRVRLASVSKPFIAAIILRLEEEERLDLDQTVGEIIPALLDSPAANVAISQLLSHRSGIPNYQYKKPFQELQSQVLMSGSSSAPVTVDKMIATFKEDALSFDPGARYEYSNANYVLLQKIIEITSERSFANALSDYVITPLGLTDTGIVSYRGGISNLASGYSVRPGGYDAPLQAQFVGVAGPGGIYSSAPDMLRWFRALFSGEFFAREDTLEKMITARSTAYNDEAFIGYGLFRSTLKVGDDSITLIGHDGWGPPYTANLQYVPHKELIIFAADSVSGLGGATHGETVRLAEDIVRAAFGQTISLPAEPNDLKLLSLIDQFGIENALDRFKSEMTRADSQPQLESELNGLGYAFLGEGNIDFAIQVFQLNTELFPNSSNTHDSLAEAFLDVGQLTAARAAYRKALALSPENERLKTIVSTFEE